MCQDYADNIYRPVPYHEPHWLYEGRLLAPMEITFATQWLLIYNAHAGFAALALSSRLQSFRKANRLIAAGYGGVSLIAAAHYLVDPVSAYSVDVNASIMGESILAGLLIVYCCYVGWRTRKC